jgi:hypothetical protein
MNKEHRMINNEVFGFLLKLGSFFLKCWGVPKTLLKQQLP